ncbi:MAG: IclR family transcriptional regulator [Treponema sp.]|nr:IclR family transcriptional regulator [Treponema sp.]
MEEALKRGSKIIHRLFRILDAIALKNVHTIDEISAETGIPRSSVHRTLQSLAGEGVVALLPKKGYGLTPRLITLGLKAMGERNILEVAIPIMKKLSRDTRETVSLHVATDYERVCLCRFEGDYPITRRVRVGDKDILFRGSAGKIIAASFSDEEIENIADRYINEGIIKAGEKAAVLEEARKTRKQGYAMSIAERISNSGSIGVPIKDFSGNIQASLTISSIQERLTKENLDRYLKLLLAASEQIFLESCHGR